MNRNAVGLFAGKHKIAIPGIPAPEHKEDPEIEQLTHPHPIQSKQPRLVKPKEDIRVPYYNHLYGSQRTDGGWQHIVDNYATGSSTLTAGAQVSVPVTLKLMPNWKILQWPGATSFMLCIRSFCATAQANIITPIETSVPATAGNVTIYTGPGTLETVTVTTTGASALNFQDGAGNIIATIPGGSVAGFTLNGQFGFQTSLVAQKSATTPVVTVEYTPSVLGGCIDILYQDTIGGQIIPFGEYNDLQACNNLDINILIPTPITDTQVQTIGNLLFSLDTNGQSGNINWQLGVSAAYLIPQLHAYKIEEKAQEFDDRHHSHYVE